MNFNNINAKVLVSRVDKRENYSLALLRDSRKDKRNDTWVKSAYPNVKFAFNAHAKIDELISALESADTFPDGNSKGVYIYLKSVSWTNEPYEKDGQKVYPSQHTVWAWDFESDSDSPGSQKLDTPVVTDDSSDDFPFDD